MMMHELENVKKVPSNLVSFIYRCFTKNLYDTF